MQKNESEALNMKLLQLYYTSCKQGRSSGSGFQVYAASEGLTEEEIIELERLCMYVAPSHLPSQPTPEEIKQDFPISFSSFQLKSGRYGICQSVYVGKDYSERFGNYFSHALILEEGAWPFPPSLMYGSKHIRTGLSEAELEIDHKPEPLPTIYLDNPNGISPASVRDFLKEQNRYTYLQNMLDGLMEREGSPGAFILAAEQADIPYWIAAIQLSFPVQIANNLSFSTYIFDPDREDYAISVTMDEGTRFSFNDINRRSDLYGFNFISNMFSEPKETYRYSEMVVTSELNIEGLKQFFNGFTLNKPTEALEQLIDLKIFLDSNKLIDPSRVKEAIAFAATYASREKSNQLMEQLSLTRLIESCPDIDTAYLISNFLIDVSNNTKDSTHEAMAANFILEKTQDFVTDDLALDDLQHFLDEQIERMNEREPIRLAFFNEDHLIHLGEHLREMNDVTKDSFYLKFALQMIHEGAHNWDNLTEKQKQFVILLGEKPFLQAECKAYEWNIFSKNPTLFAELSVELYKHYSSTTKDLFFNAFLTFVEANASNNRWTETCFDILSQTRTGQKLMEQKYTNMLEDSSTIDEMSEVLIRASHIPSVNVTPFILHYVETLPQMRDDVIGSIAKVMNQEKIYSILEDHGVIENILDEGQKHIDFSDQSIKKHLKDYEQFITYYQNIGVEDSLYKLAVVTYKVKQKRRKNFDELEKALISNLSASSELSKHVLQAYVTWSIPELTEMIYGKKHDTFVTKLIKAHPTQMLHAITTRKQDTKIKHAPELLVDIFKGLNQKGMNDESYKRMVDYFLTNEDDGKKTNELFNKQPRLQKKWDEMYEDVQNQKGNSFVRSFKRIFGSKK